jgi:beta-barrel assembly-enhancing protease
MTRTLTVALATFAAACTIVPPATAAPPATAPQLGSLMKAAKQVEKARGLVITEEDEIKLGAAVSEKVRTRYGVVQDAGVHRYVTLVGAVAAVSSKRANLPWTFIVLDTDGVNAFATPGGFIHITRGALGLLTNEAELAGVLAHEISHVTGKHTVKALQKGKVAQLAANETLGDKAVFNRLADTMTELVLAGFSRDEELDADREGTKLANDIGYAPNGLQVFLQRLADRNKASTEKQGLFASHPEMQARLDALAMQAAALKPAGTATLEARYRKNISYKTKAQTDIAAVEAGAAGLAGGSGTSTAKQEPRKDEPKKRGFGLGGLLKPTGSESKSAEVTGSGASRGVDTERNAKGGSNPAIVVVNVQASDINAFKKEGNLR